MNTLVMMTLAPCLSDTVKVSNLFHTRSAAATMLPIRVPSKAKCQTSSFSPMLIERGFLPTVTKTVAPVTAPIRYHPPVLGEMALTW